MFVPMFKIPTNPTALFVAGLVGLACSSLTGPPDGGGMAGGGQTGGTSSENTGGGLGGTIAGSSPNQGGQTGPSPQCTSMLLCAPDDQQVDGLCPAERECYSLYPFCFNSATLCMLPEGVHCNDLACNPGDTETTWNDEGCFDYPNTCYVKQLCLQSVVCRYGTDGGVDAAVSDAGVDAVVADAGMDASASDAGVDEGAAPHCGDGILEMTLGEQCDLGPRNGVCLDSQGNPADAGQEDSAQGTCPEGTYIVCTTACQLPRVPPVPATTAIRRELQRGRGAAVVTTEAGEHRHNDNRFGQVASCARNRSMKTKRVRGSWWFNIGQGVRELRLLGGALKPSSWSWPATLTATFTDGTGAIDPSIGSVTSGVDVPTPALSDETTYTLTVTNAAGSSVTETVTVDVFVPDAAVD